MMPTVVVVALTEQAAVGFLEFRACGGQLFPRRVREESAVTRPEPWKLTPRASIHASAIMGLNEIAAARNILASFQRPTTCVHCIADRARPVQFRP
jgi:hypothetical protein